MLVCFCLVTVIIIDMSRNAGLSLVTGDQLRPLIGWSGVSLKSYAVTRDHYDHTIDIIYLSSHFIDLLGRLNHDVPGVLTQFVDEKSGSEGKCFVTDNIPLKMNRCFFIILYQEGKSEEREYQL